MQLAAARQLCGLIRGSAPDSDVVWPEVANAARAQDIVPDLYHALRVWPGAVPQWLLNDLHTEFRCAIVRSLKAHQELAKIVATFGERGIGAVVLKGASVSAYYPDPALRPFGDIDLLVRSSDIDKAQSALQCLSYAASISSDWMQEHHRHVPAMTSRESGWTVELHFRLTNPGAPLAMPVDPLWDRLVERTVEGTTFHALDPIDQVMHIAQHAFVQHRFANGLRGTLDIARIVGGWADTQWQDLIERANTIPWHRCMALALGLADGIWGLSSLSQRASEWIRAAPGEQLDLDWVFEYLWAEKPYTSTVVSVQARNELRSRLRRVLFGLFPPRQLMAAIYRSEPRGPQLWVSYLRRPFDLWQRHGRALLPLIRREPGAEDAWRDQVTVERWVQSLGASGTPPGALGLW